MKTSEYKLKTEDGAEIQVYEWLPDNLEKIKGIVQIAHGMAEHSGRYSDFAQYLTNNNYGVYANDHRGHGKTAGKLENVGFLAPKNGWLKLVSDFKELTIYIKTKHPDKPIYLLGHSMGSFVVRNYIMDAPIKLNGIIISGTGGHPGFLGSVGIMLTRILMLFFQKNTPSPLMDNLTFGAFNNPFKPNRTKYDWLSHDNEIVDKYVDDPYCGGIFSLGFFYDLLSGLMYVNTQKNINSTPEDLPLLIFSGDKDPVGKNGKGVNQVYNKFKKAGLKNITLKLFANGRHEMLNETNHHEVYEFVLDWIKKNY